MKFKFKKGDPVEIINGLGEGEEGFINLVDKTDHDIPYQVKTQRTFWWKIESNLRRIKCPEHKTRKMYSTKDEEYFCPFCQ